MSTPSTTRLDQPRTAFLFDLDGTLVDSVYQHVLAWREALEAEGIELSVWRIHRRIGMSGGPADQHAAARDRACGWHPAQRERLRQAHADALNRRQDEIRPLPGARALLAQLTESGHPLGHRHQRPHGDRPPGAGEAGGRSRRASRWSRAIR